MGRRMKHEEMAEYLLNLATVAIKAATPKGVVKEGVHVVSKTHRTAQVVVKKKKGSVTRHLHKVGNKWYGLSPTCYFDWQHPTPNVVQFVGGGL